VKAGNIAAARQLYQKVLELYPSESSSLLALSSLEFSDGNIEKSVNLLEKGLQRSPQDISLRLALARLYLRTGQPSRNINLVYEAPEGQGEHPLMLQVLGDSQYALGEFGAAAGTYEKVLRQVPDSLTGHYLLARTYAANNQMDLAKKHVGKVIELDPQNFAASVMEIRILRLERKEQEAIELLKSLDPGFQDRPEILIEKGWLAIYQKQYDQAISALERAFEQVPSNSLVVQLGIAKWNSGDETGALEGYKSWLQANPDDIQILFHLANGYLQLGRNKEAIATFEQLLDKTPDDPILMNNLAWLLRESNPKRALELAQKTTSIAPEWGSGIDTLGMIYLEKGDTAEAYRYFEQALKQAPDDPEIRYHVALASSKLGEKEQARQILKAILADPEYQFDSRKDAEKLQAALQQ
jgi:putative PEP-CTERM system TPR-repeat lipoprotein